MQRLKTKTVICPVCDRGKLIIRSDTGPRLKVYKPEDSQKAEWFVKCQVCKSQVGVSVEQ